MQGPPGTGKTSTIVALASAFLSLQPDASLAAPVKLPKGQQAPAQKHLGRILVCAQSNAAVDELTLRLATGVLDRHTGNTRYGSLWPSCIVLREDPWLPVAHFQMQATSDVESDVTSSIPGSANSGTFSSMSENFAASASLRAAAVCQMLAMWTCMCCRKAAVVRMGLMAATHADVQALHIDALCQKHLGSDKDLHERKGVMQL